MSLANKIAPSIAKLTNTSTAGEAIDTSFLLEELRRKYASTHRPVEVDFRKLVDWVRLGDQLTHQIHPYPAKLLPNIAHFFTRASAYTKKSIVLDPFCGSGTVALEASLAGLKPYVADANPLALLITKVKTTPLDPDELREAAICLLRQSARYKVAPAIAIVNDHLWYSAEKKKSLEILLRAINEIENVDHRDFFQLCLSATARKLSFADPAIAVPVRLKTKEIFSDAVNKKITDRLSWIESSKPASEFAKMCELNISRIAETNLMYPERLAAIPVGVDARCLQDPKSKRARALTADTVPLVITSPPYGSAQKYIRSTSLSLNWLEFATPDQLSTLEGKSIGREHIPKYRETPVVERLPKKYERVLQTIREKNKTREQITRQYLYDMKSAMTEMARVTASKGHVVLVVGNNQVCGEYLRNDEYFVDTMEDLGLELEISLIDHIKSRGLMTKRNKTASVITRESVLVFSKR